MADYSRGSMASLTATVALGIAIFFTLYSLIPVTRADQPGLSSLYVGTMMVFVMGIQAFTPALVRRLSLRGVLAGAGALLAIGALVTGLAVNTAMLLVGAVAAGAAFGTLVVAGSQGVALLTTPAKLGKALGMYGLITMAASALGSPAGVQLALTFSTRVFGICAFCAGVLAIVLTFGIPSAVGRARRDRLTADDLADTSSNDAGTNSAGQEADLTAQGSTAHGSTANASAMASNSRTRPTGAAWPILALMLISVIMLSHGLTSFPVLASAFGSATIVFAVQAGNALGRGLGGQLQARITTGATALSGALMLVVGAVLGVLATNTTGPLAAGLANGGTIGATAAIAAGALIGLGVGTIQTAALHAAMLQMGSGRASVIWNLCVDGGLWAGGILWGLALSAGLAELGVLVFAALALVGLGLVWRVR